MSEVPLYQAVSYERGAPVSAVRGVAGARADVQPVFLRLPAVSVHCCWHLDVQAKGSGVGQNYSE